MTVTKEDYWSIILNDPTQIGQITTEDAEFNRRVNDVNVVLSNTFINSSDENLISKWETSLYIDGIEGKTITERKADILYRLCEKNYVPVSIIKRFLFNLIGDENRFVVEFIKDENKLVIHTDRFSDDMIESVTSLLEGVVLQNVEVVRYNHDIEVSWRDINKYAACKSVDEMKAINPNYKTDLTSDSSWIWPLDNLVNAESLLQNARIGGEIRLYIPNVTTKCYRILNDINRVNGNTKYCDVYIYAPKLQLIGTLFMMGSWGVRKCIIESVDISNSTNLENFASSCTDLEEFWMPDLPKLAKIGNCFSGTKLNKPSILRLLAQLPNFTFGIGTHTATIGIHVDHQNDEEVLAAIADAESKGWTLTVQWNGTPTRKSSTMAMGSLIYAKIIEHKLPDGTIEQYLDWGHYVTDETGYETFRSLESAYKYFNLEQPTEI